MPANKDHHYVSQFYMRNFGTGNSIALFNLAQRRHIPTAPIPGQCQRAYFYGRDGDMETKLQRIEGDASNAIRSILETNTLPSPNSDAHRALTTFISFQISRTPDAVAVMRRIQERLGDAHVKIFAELSGESPPASALDQVRANWWPPQEESLKNAEVGAPILLDLKLVLLRCPDRHAFITSDGPAVLFNPWCRGWKAGGVTGLASSGLIVFLPLSPRHVLLLLDEEVYAVADAALRGPVDVRDVKGLNAIQLLGAEKNLYYRDEAATRTAIDELPLGWHRPRVEYVRVKRGYSDVDNSFLVFFYQEQPDVRLDFRFLRVRTDKKDIPLRERARSWRARARQMERQINPADTPRRPAGVPGQRWRIVPDDL